MMGTNIIPGRSHFLGPISAWAHLLKTGSSKSECLLMTWLMNALNFAHITIPLPSNVDVALQ